MTFGQKPLTCTLKNLYPLCGGYRLPVVHQQILIFEAVEP